MDDFEEVIDSVDVPKNTGLEGFLHVVRGYLRMPRIQEITIDARGKVKVRRFVRKNDTVRNVGIDFEQLSPYAIVRNGDVEEVMFLEGANAAVVIGSLLDKASTAQYKPLAFVTGAATVLWDWYKMTTGVRLSDQNSLHGLQLYRDRHLEDTVLILATGYGRDAAFVDTRLSYKVELPVYRFSNTGVEVL